MSLLEGVLLGLIQGITEFLPVSSSGHLVLAGELMGVETGTDRTLLPALLHLASVAAILVFFRSDLPRLFRDRRRELAWILLASVPAAVVGLLLKERIDAAFARPALVGALWMGTGIVLIGVDRVKKQGIGMTEAGPCRVIGIGLAQALAVLPGVSRSGLTVSAGVFAGIRRGDAFRFAFLLGIPAILGAGGLKIRDGLERGIGVEALPLAASLAVTFAASLGSLALLRVVLERRCFSWFGVYCLGLGTLTLLWFGFR